MYEDHNMFTICRDNYNSDEDMWADIAIIARILTKNAREVLVRYEDCGVYIIEDTYDPHHTDYGTPRFAVITADEEDELLERRIDQQDSRKDITEE